MLTPRNEARWPPGWRGAVVGCGSAGSRIARLLLGLGVPASALTGYDVAPDAPAGGWPSAIPVKRGDSGQISGDVRADVWFVCTPADQRRRWYEIALRGPATRGIFAEKPLATCCADVASLVAESDAREVVTQVGYCWRWHPVAGAARRWLARRDLRFVSALAVCAVDRGQWAGRPSSYGRRWAELSHELDLLRYLLGPGTASWAHGSALHVAHASGASAIAWLDWNVHGTYFRGLRIIAANGVFDWQTHDIADAGVCSDPFRADGWTPDVMYGEELASFIESVVDGHRVRCPWDEGLEVLAWCDKAQEVAP